VSGPGSGWQRRSSGETACGRLAGAGSCSTRGSAGRRRIGGRPIWGSVAGVGRGSSRLQPGSEGVAGGWSGSAAGVGPVAGAEQPGPVDQGGADSVRCRIGWASGDAATAKGGPAPIQAAVLLFTVVVACMVVVAMCLSPPSPAPGVGLSVRPSASLAAFDCCWPFGFRLALPGFRPVAFVLRLPPSRALTTGPLPLWNAGALACAPLPSLAFWAMASFASAPGVSGRWPLGPWLLFFRTGLGLPAAPC
jgi:hypothetical protein